MPNKQSSGVSIGKFDILATYAYAKALRDGLDVEEAKQQGVAEAIKGANIRQGHPPETNKDVAAKKGKSSITAETFDRQVVDKLGTFFVNTFLPAMKKLVAAELSYVDVKRIVRIPATWGAKLTEDQFEERIGTFLETQSAGEKANDVG
jgi:hypothetical protein